jgi:excisionase family DNA binding protein
MKDIRPDSTGPLLRINEAAAKLAVRPRTIQCWMAARKIPYIKLGHSVRFRAIDLERMIESCAVDAITHSQKGLV